MACTFTKHSDTIYLKFSVQFNDHVKSDRYNYSETCRINCICVFSEVTLAYRGNILCVNRQFEGLYV